MIRHKRLSIILNSAKALADNLGVIGSFDVEVLNQFEANISNKDSLTHLLDRTMKRTADFPDG